jgi:hypothetical protein
MLCFGLFDIVVQEYDYLADVVIRLFDIAVQEYDNLADVVFGLFDIVVKEYDYLVDVVFWPKHNIHQIVIFLYYNIK